MIKTHKEKVPIDEISTKAFYFADELVRRLGAGTHTIGIYPVPMGGLIPAIYIMQYLNKVKNINAFYCDEIIAMNNFVIVDDLVDSGSTFRECLLKSYSSKPQRMFFIPFFISKAKEKELKKLVNSGKNLHLELITHNPLEKKDSWLVFPWEEKKNETVQNNIRRILQYIGEDPERDGLKLTPDRVVRSFKELYGGYKQTETDIYAVFDNDNNEDQMIILSGCEFSSTCEHHMLPFCGLAHIAYIPNNKNKKIVGVSKLARILDMYARRLQVQERITQSVTESLVRNLDPLGAACVLEASHLCMSCRGVRKQNSRMITSSLKGAFRTDSDARSEFYKLIGR